MSQADISAGVNIPVLISLSLAVPTLGLSKKKIVSILDAIDRKIDLHRRKRAVLDDLFKTLLHKLMTGEIRVGEFDLSTFTDLEIRKQKQ